MLRFLGALILCAVVGVLGASPAVARVEPCLVTSAQIEDAIGIELVQEFAGAQECSYISIEGEGPPVGLGILVGESPTKAEAKRLFKDQKAIVTDVRAVKGVGNAAFTSKGLGDAGVMVAFRKGLVVATITVLVFDESPSPDRDQLIELGKAAAKNV
jgi:hypothetical protein